MKGKPKEFKMESFVAEEEEPFEIPGKAREVEYDYFFSPERDKMLVRVSYLLPIGWDTVL